MKTRLYLDYNATSPLSLSFKSFLEKGDFPFANPASIHASGKSSRKIINEVESYLRSCFGLEESVYRLIFHSGATEGIRTFFESSTNKDAMFYCESDHPATLATARALARRGVHTQALAIEHDGNFKLSDSINQINEWKSKNEGRVFVNFLYLHNETGVKWSLEDALELKRQTGAFVHVDATQTPGKIPRWNSLVSELDCYTYSAHKFGALKGVGFSFVKVDYPYTPILEGGAQQSGLRGGTENPLGALSVKLALEDIEKVDLTRIEALRDKLEAMVSKRDDTIIVGNKSVHGRSVNTLNFILKNKKADISLIQFDLAGIDLSSGSACSAGSVEPSRTLELMGLSEYAKNGLRLSLGFDSLTQENEILTRFEIVLNRL
ncbi:MAG: aminotransferase class V-fold PLP-dependent enzyme [Bacteriovoracaceae bacterium]|nr:aminotransferase class V-fold PLP-dependent enzyme [Bacteriovoracaceae bacterium]